MEERWLAAEDGATVVLGGPRALVEAAARYLPAVGLAEVAPPTHRSGPAAGDRYLELADLPRADEPTLRVDGRDRPGGWAAVESELSVFAAEHLVGRIAVHAGLVVHEGEVIVLPGPSFAGKSTLCAAMGDLGALVRSDEYALVDLETGLVTGWPRPLRRRHPATDRFRRIFEGAALGLWVLAVACLARDLAAAVGGGALAEAGIRVTAWLATAYAILRARGTRGMAGAAFTLLLVLVVVVGGFDLLVVSMPLATGDPVGAWPILNALLPAYGLPALLFALMAGHRRAIAWQRRAAGAAALLLALLWGFFEVRRAFLGPVLIGPMSQSELYAHSLLLLTAAVLLLAAGLLRASLDLRRAGLALLAAAILKVFLVDLGNLEGVLRAASFMGLGLCLIGAGWAFRRWGRAPAGRSA